MRRPDWLHATLGVLVFVTAGVVVFLALIGLVSNLVLAVVLGVVLIDATFAVFRHVVALRSRRRAAAHDHLLCPDCTYDLRTLDQAGACPECGRPYEHAAVRAQWLDADRRLTRTPRG